jgi:small-conductance mechanosensitive channel
MKQYVLRVLSWFDTAKKSLCVWIRFGLILVLCFACPIQGLAGKPEKKTMNELVKEVGNLQVILEKTQKRITHVLDQIGADQRGLDQKAGKVDGKAAEVVTTQLEYFSRHVQSCLTAFLSYLDTTAQALVHPLALKKPPSFTLNFVGLLASFFVSIFSVGLGRKVLQTRIEKSILCIKYKSIIHLGRLNTILILPIAGYFFLCLILGMVMHACGIDPFSKWHLNACALFPMHLYTIWALYTWVGIVWMPHRPSQGFVIMSPEDARKRVFWLHMVIGVYAFCSFFLSVVSMLVGDSFEKTAICHTILDVGMLVAFWCVYRALAIDIGDLSLNANPKKILRAVTVVRWLFSGVAVLWLMGQAWFLFFLKPLAMTIMVWIFLYPTKQLFRHYRLRFLWKRRHKNFFLKPLFISYKFFAYFADFLAYGITLSIWYPYVEKLLGAGNWTVLVSLRTMVFSGLFNALLILCFALFIIKVGDRILRYYVEEKYTSDSLENNFLASRLKTLMAMLKTSLRVVVWIPSAGLMFSQFGEVNISAWVTSIGAASFGLTFGLQHIVRDFISGFFIILENNLMVGDEVEVDTRSGKVESITIRTLKIRSDQGMLLTIPFGNIQVIGNKNRLFSAVVMNISVGYGENLERVQALIEKAFTMVKRLPLFGRRIVGPLEIRGVNEVTCYSVVFQVKITTAPNMQDSIRRAYNRQLKQLFDEAGVVVPVPPISAARALPSLTNTIL